MIGNDGEGDIYIGTIGKKVKREREISVRGRKTLQVYLNVYLGCVLENLTVKPITVYQHLFSHKIQLYNYKMHS